MASSISRTASQSLETSRTCSERTDCAARHAISGKKQCHLVVARRVCRTLHRASSVQSWWTVLLVRHWDDAAVVVWPCRRTRQSCCHVSCRRSRVPARSLTTVVSTTTSSGLQHRSTASAVLRWERHRLMPQYVWLTDSDARCSVSCPSVWLYNWCASRTTTVSHANFSVLSPYHCTTSILPTWSLTMCWSATDSQQSVRHIATISTVSPCTSARVVSHSATTWRMWSLAMVSGIASMTIRWHLSTWSTSWTRSVYARTRICFSIGSVPFDAENHWLSYFIHSQ